jgi:hypothetical protein
MIIQNRDWIERIWWIEDVRNLGCKYLNLFDEDRDHACCEVCPSEFGWDFESHYLNYFHIQGLNISANIVLRLHWSVRVSGVINFSSLSHRVHSSIIYPTKVQFKFSSSIAPITQAKLQKSNSPYPAKPCLLQEQSATITCENTFSTQLSLSYWLRRKISIQVWRLNQADHTNKIVTS